MLFFFLETVIKCREDLQSQIYKKKEKSFHVCGYYEPSQEKAIWCVCVYQKYKRRKCVYVCACVYVASILSWFISYLDQYLSIIPLQLHTSVEALAIHKQTYTVSLTSGGNNAIIFFHLLKSHANLSSVCKGQGGKTQSSLKLHLNQCVSGTEKRWILALWVLSYGRGFKGIL